jgi:hypothetical protein
LPLRRLRASRLLLLHHCLALLLLHHCLALLLLNR